MTDQKETSTWAQECHDFATGKSSFSAIQTECSLTEHGLVVVLRSEDAMQLASRWALNGEPVSFRLKMEQ